MISRRLVNILSDNSRKNNLKRAVKKNEPKVKKNKAPSKYNIREAGKGTFIYMSRGYDAVRTSLARR
jgi:hypothetical protein